MSPNFINIALIGDHCVDFISELKKAGHTPVEFGSADEFLPLMNDHQVVSLSGADHGLTDMSAISGLLNAGKVLVAFNPGTEYLNSLHAATCTPIDLTAVKSTADRPLIIYKTDDGMNMVLRPEVKTDVQVPNGKFQPVHRSNIILNAATRTAEVNEMPYDYAQIVEQIKKAVDAVNQPPTELKQPLAVGEVDGLDPGPDVAFYRKITLLIPYNYSVKTLAWTSDGTDVETNDVNQIQVYHTEWKMTIYVYATNGSPVGQTANSYPGTIYTYIIHDGVHGRASGSPGRSYGPGGGLRPSDRSWEYYFVDIMGYNVQDTSGLLSKVTQQPDENAVEHREDVFSYNIAREQKMTLLTASKNKYWEFDAKYQKTCAWNRFQMHRDMPNWNDAGYILSYNDYYDVWSDPGFETDKWWNTGVFDTTNDKTVVKRLPDDNLAISGLTVFSSKVGKAQLRLELDYVPRAFDTGTKTFPVKYVSGAGVISLYVDDVVLDLTWNE